MHSFKLYFKIRCREFEELLDREANARNQSVALQNLWKFLSTENLMQSLSKKLMNSSAPASVHLPSASQRAKKVTAGRMDQANVVTTENTLYFINQFLSCDNECILRKEKCTSYQNDQK